MRPPCVDMHCHLDLYPQPGAAVGRCQETDAYVLSVTTTPKAWRGTVALAKGVRRIRTALGMHPQIVHERSGELSLFEALLPETRYVGEVGLDGGADLKAHFGRQVQVFDSILAMADAAGGRIITVHSRRAASEVLAALHRRPRAGVPVMHWFTGSKAELASAAGMGCWFSVGPAMLASQSGRERASAMPRDRVLTETDGPFGTSRRRALEPAEVGGAIRVLAGMWGMDETETASTVFANFRRLAATSVGGPHT